MRFKITCTGFVFHYFPRRDVPQIEQEIQNIEAAIERLKAAPTASFQLIEGFTINRGAIAEMLSRKMWKLHQEIQELEGRIERP